MNAVIRNLLIFVLFISTYSSFSQLNNQQAPKNELVNFKLGTSFETLKDSILFEQSQNNSDIYLYTGNRHKKFLDQDVELTRMVFSKRTNMLVSMKAELRESLLNNKEVVQEANRINKLIAKAYGSPNKIRDTYECYLQLQYRWKGKGIVLDMLYGNMSTSIVITDRVFFDEAAQGF